MNWVLKSYAVTRLSPLHSSSSTQTGRLIFTRRVLAQLHERGGWRQGPIVSMPSTLSLLFLALSRTCAQLVTSDTLYVVLTTDAATCASARLAPIASKSECDNAVAAINAANGWPGHGTTGQVSYSFRPSGCFSNCFTTSGYYCVYFNTADTSHGVEGDRRVFCSSQPLPALPP